MSFLLVISALPVAFLSIFVLSEILKWLKQQ